MAINTMYEFTLNRVKEIEEPVEVKDGEEIIKGTKKVKKEVPVKLALRKPNRKEKDKMSLFYIGVYGEAISNKAVSEAILLKRFENDNGLLSDAEKQQFSGLQELLIKTEDELQHLMIKPVDQQTDEEKEKIKQLLTSLAKTKNDIQLFYNQKSNIFTNTAETYARNQTIIRWLINLASIQNDAGEYEFFFKGKNDEEKLDNYDSLNESEEDFIKLALDRFLLSTTAWCYNRATKQEDFELLFKEIES